MKCTAYVAAVDRKNYSTLLKNPVYRTDGVVLSFDDNGPTLRIPLEEGKSAEMHRATAEHFLDANNIPWAIARAARPSIVISAADGLAVVTWPFRLTGPLPYTVAEVCDHEGFCTVPMCDNYVVYGGHYACRKKQR